MGSYQLLGHHTQSAVRLQQIQQRTKRTPKFEATLVEDFQYPSYLKVICTYGCGRVIDSASALSIQR